ncbi:hypothetical protein SAMN05444274_108123 [Mariniphaga anaerophila]|uniref:Uncharacterized protein n=1 Tax=Mariniphaga anaerophila TaxID=1484053 RepID=A0A1M5E832_9BACT|nr:hypothetical protein [Mariniphaga anaerophila]SHF75377.1 hypothetical protein SAMN05444274_108123 [Mariniphaga anaerophila]
MKTTKFLGLPLLIFVYLVVSVPFQSCEPDDEINECDTCSMVYKPNIYIYPEEQMELSVRLKFPLGGKIVTSIPEYGNGWNINVDTSGVIDNAYSFLFYESKQPDVWQRNYGWEVEADQLDAFFRHNMKDYGFNSAEIQDFIDYWIPRLNSYQVYSICPQTKDIIKRVIQIEFSKQPENVLRLFYVIKGSNQFQDNLTEPAIDEFRRDGYFVTEWGVILE